MKKNNFYKILFLLVSLLFFKGEILAQTNDTINVPSLQLETQNVLPNIDDSVPPFIKITEKRKSLKMGGWFFMLNIALLLVLIIKFFLTPIVTRRFWNAWFNQNLFFQIIRDKKVIAISHFIIEWLIRVYIITIFVLLLILFLTERNTFTFKQLGILYAILFIFLSLKSLATFLISMLTEQYSKFKALNILNVMYSSNIAWWVIPITGMIFYLETSYEKYAFFLLLIAASMLFLTYVYRSFNILNKLNMSVNLHFFTYLCAFEIVPYFVLVKVVYNFNLV